MYGLTVVNLSCFLREQPTDLSGGRPHRLQYAPHDNLPETEETAVHEQQRAGKAVFSSIQCSLTDRHPHLVSVHPDNHCGCCALLTGISGTFSIYSR